ncbi:MAG: BamA/TamA family outer membrane protein [Massilibacteroides sp.]|nr:BamA/TamA family outer membrane protein [Massilibacteroides sp.]MDD3063043.1 BamA/TamA family outer membrane protein [Massilibacteroides sp.]MDD4114180.1 BamA/TamA family outer membrane protein [Massilibacteroides sp.]MDD4660552.1 BamA/TamA family outer membrane protein [Massilibacteroides sp.]
MRQQKVLLLRILSFCLLLLLAACSTTRNLPEGEILYTGIKALEIEDTVNTKASKTAKEEVEAALAYAPNNALFGSSSIRTPFPFGLWVYNAFVNKRGVVNKWIFETLAAQPVFVGTVNPEVRVKVAKNLLNEHGFFNGMASYELVPDKKDSLKASVRYHIVMNQAYTYDSIRHIRFRHRADTIMQMYQHRQVIRPGDNFNVMSLEEERQRISTLLRNEGYYYFRPEHIVYQADTTIFPGKVSLRLMRNQNTPRNALRPWKIGNVSVHMSGYENELPTDSIRYKDITIYYEGKLRVRPTVLYRQLKFKSGNYYSERRQERTQEAFAKLGIFRYTDMQYMPRDTSRRCDTLDLRINTVYDYPLDGELEFNFKAKSNDQMGPGTVFSLTKRNLFGGGESLTGSINGSYEWQTGRRINQAGGAINSYEFGASMALTFPRVVFPGLLHKGLDNYSNTIFRLSGDQLNRAGFFKMLALSGSLTYEYRPTRNSMHTITPFRLSYNKLRDPTPAFDSITTANRALFLSLQDQFVPVILYTYTYDRPVRRWRDRLWWEFSVSEAGNLISGIYALNGRRFSEKNKTILVNPYAQFIKMSNELRYNRWLDKNQSLAGRIMVGAIYSYGNARISPYSEQFFIGGSNSIRAFTIRSIGPGRFVPDKENRYAYIDQTGDFKLEANLEYRFRMIKDLHGALFFDAGNVWLLRRDESRPGGYISDGNMLKDLALGTGFGFRYDMDFLVVRFDVGIGLHLPYDTGEKGYYNIPRFKDGLGFHLAIGYPF